MEINNIEKFFLNTLLKITMAGVAIVLISDAIIYPEDRLSLIIDVCILSTAVTAYLLRNRYQTTSVLVFTSIVLIAMFYQSIVVPVNTTTSLSIILTVGFVLSVMLKGKLMWIMHSIAFIGLLVIFAIQIFNPTYRLSDDSSDIITIAITYSILYFILSYAAGALKTGYDRINSNLSEANEELKFKADKIEAQNKELVKIQNDLNTLNKDLENIVNERTRTLRDRTEQLERYSYSNAHHLRGPIARLLGLLSLHKMEQKPNTRFFFKKMEDQVQEIDSVVKQINKDLEDSNLSNENE